MQTDREELVAWSRRGEVSWCRNFTSVGRSLAGATKALMHKPPTHG